MKLVRYGEAGRERPGLIDKDGAVRSLEGHLDELAGPALGDLKRLASLDPDSLPRVDGSPRLGSCVPKPGNFIAVGLNYSDHAAETGATVPAEPILFNKAPSCTQGPNDTVVIPKDSKKTDWEVELAIVIGRTASNIEESQSLDHIAGYCVCNDISERAWQSEGTGQWMKGKGAPTFGPLGPWLVTPDEVPDPQALDMFLDLNGKRMQSGSTATMVFGVTYLVAYISRFLLLEPGDVITTGTPPGVGLGMKPPVFLKAGDTMELGIEGLGRQRQEVVAYGG